MPKKKGVRNDLPLEDVPTLGDDHGYDWHALAVQQGQLSADAFRGHADGHIFAVEDRNSSAHSSWRRVLVRVHESEDEVHIFDALGALIHEKSKGVMHGKLSFQIFLKEFTANGEELYRPPQLRAHPKDRSASRSQPNSVITARKVVCWLPRDRT